MNAKTPIVIEGREARRGNVPVHACPHIGHGDLMWAWLRGWRAEDRKFERARIR